MVEDGETCDPGGVDAPDCDRDCSEVRCGDGLVNEAAGELCDDGNTETVDACNEFCLPNAFWDDMEDEERSLGQWNPSTPSFSTMGGTPYALDPSQGWVLGLPGMTLGVWHSGPYSEDPGVARLITDEIAFPPDPPPPGTRYELHFRHTFRFDGNESQDLECAARGTPVIADGAFAWILLPGNLPRQVAPLLGTGDLLVDPGGCVQPNPLFSEGGVTVFGGVSEATFSEVSVPLGMVAPNAQVAFDVGYDCSNCWGAGPAGMSAPAPGWVIDDVVIGLFPI